MTIIKLFTPLKYSTEFIYFLCYGFCAHNLSTILIETVINLSNSRFLILYTDWWCDAITNVTFEVAWAWFCVCVITILNSALNLRIFRGPHDNGYLFPLSSFVNFLRHDSQLSILILKAFPEIEINLFFFLS